MPGDESGAAATVVVAATADLVGRQPPSASVHAKKVWPAAPQFAQTCERVQAVPFCSLPSQPFLPLKLKQTVESKETSDTNGRDTASIQ